MQITSGKIAGAQKCVVYGPEGIGKSTFASKFPNPVFCDTEGSTKHMDVRRTPKPQSFIEIMEQVRYFIAHPGELGTFVLDTADWAEKLCAEQLCSKAQKTGLEDFGYGKGYVYLMEEFGKLLNLLEELIEKGVHVVVTAHAKMRKFEQPDEMGAYDRWEMKLSKQVAPLVKEWADMVLFVSYKTYVVNVDDQGVAKGKNKVQGGVRVMRTTHHPCWDAKNRHDLDAELPFDYGRIAHIFTGAQSVRQGLVPVALPPKLTTVPVAPPPPEPAAAPDDDYAGIPPALRALMDEHEVTPGEIRHAVSQRKYYPAATPIQNYDPDFIKGVLIGAWPKVLDLIRANRGELPF